MQSYQIRLIDENCEPIDIDSLSPERRRIAKVFKVHVDKAIEELGPGYVVTLQGRFDATTIRIEIEVEAQGGEIP